ncbi:MAG: hypothetical protein DRP87_07820 [Spirochaetes bacterium]|nr:MAG: hypothetical protein DRP87_07820 [Spirochaetota bacterium]
MKEYSFNPLLGKTLLPVDIVFHPSWWFYNEGITFDEDFFYHPGKRVESEKKMEDILYNRFGKYGLGELHGKDLPVIGAIHQAAGFLISEMLGCKIEYREDAAPQVIPANTERPEVVVEKVFGTPAFRRLEKLLDRLETKYGYLTGDINWSGILNVALDLKGDSVFIDMVEKPEEVKRLFRKIGEVIERFTSIIMQKTHTSSISVNRNVRHLKSAVYLHSECSHTMISVEDYKRTLMQFDIEWSKKFRPFGIHYCGKDPHRFAEVFAELPYLDFLDVGWGGDILKIRQQLPGTFLNIRLSPVELIKVEEEEIKKTIEKLVRESGNPFLTGVCCINMDHNVKDSKVIVILETVETLREKYRKEEY